MKKIPRYAPTINPSEKQVVKVLRKDNVTYAWNERGICHKYINGQWVPTIERINS